MFSLGQSLVEEGRESEALIYLKNCLQGKPNWMAPRILLGKCLIIEDQISSAKAILLEALQLAIKQNHEDPESEIRNLLAELTA
jgi:hypothetical protein